MLHNALGPHSMNVTTCVTSLSRLMYRGTEVGIFMSRPRQNFMCTPRRKGLEGAATSYSFHTDQQHPACGGANSSTASFPCSADVSNFRSFLLYQIRIPSMPCKASLFPPCQTVERYHVSFRYPSGIRQVSSRYPSYFCT